MHYLNSILDSHGTWAISHGFGKEIHEQQMTSQFAQQCLLKYIKHYISMCSYPL
jgi:hypothetical protein